jgi:SAM-dependent methyltransferase
MHAHYYEGQDLEALATLPAYQEWILEKFRPYLRGKVIEIGAGLGSITSRYADGVEDLLLVEPAKNLEGMLKERFESRPHVRVLSELVEKLHADALTVPAAHGAPFDSALMVNVLEHVGDDASLLSSIRGILRPKGALLLFVPACPWLYGTLDEKVGHARRYTLRGLERLVRGAGFAVETIRYFDLLGVLPWFFLGRVRRMREFSPRWAGLYDRLVVPIARAIERYFKPPLGKNLLCIARAGEADLSTQPRGVGNGSTR